MAKIANEPGYEKLSTALSGLAGTYAVAAELCRRGYVATLTVRNAKGVDITCLDPETGDQFSIQVKTNQAHQKSWMLSVDAETYRIKNLFYVFVNLSSQNGSTEFHVVPCDTVADFVKENHATWLATPGAKGQVRNDSSMRKFFDLDCNHLNRWDVLKDLR